MVLSITQNHSLLNHLMQMYYLKDFINHPNLIISLLCFAHYFFFLTANPINSISFCCFLMALQAHPHFHHFILVFLILFSSSFNCLYEIKYLICYFCFMTISFDCYYYLLMSLYYLDLQHHFYLINISIFDKLNLNLFS